MDTGKFTCNICGGKIRTDLDMCGDTIECPHCSNSIMIPLTGISSGMQVSNYVLKERVGLGAMGEVWMAIVPSSYRRVALKILSPALTRDDVFIERFRREVAIVASLSHPNIITAFDAGIDRNIHFLAINYVDGSDLEKLLRSGTRFSEHEALSIALLVANALKYAWDRKNIVHRDIKPSNIMIDKDGIVYLMDLGVSRSIGRRKSTITSAGQFVGTPHFMSPEQARSQADIDFSSDIYSLGCTLYNLIAKRPPFDADSNVEILNKHIEDEPRPVSAFNPDASPACDALLSTMMAKDRARRQSSWSEVISDIAKVMDQRMPSEGEETTDFEERGHQDCRVGAKEMVKAADRLFPSQLKNRIDRHIYLAAGILAAIVFLALWWIIAGS